jgi:hypothetical protein
MNQQNPIRARPATEICHFSDRLLVEDHRRDKQRSDPGRRGRIAQAITKTRRELLIQGLCKHFPAEEEDDSAY